RMFPKSDLVGMKSLLDHSVYDATGNYVGKIEEIVLDSRSGCARHAVIAVGGVLGIGRRRLAVPWVGLKAGAGKRRCVVDIAQMDLMAVQLPGRDAWLRHTASSSPPGARAIGADD